MLAGTNLTIMTDEINGTEYITVDSFGAEVTIVTPAAFACNVSSPTCGLRLHLNQLYIALLTTLFLLLGIVMSTYCCALHIGHICSMQCCQA